MDVEHAGGTDPGTRRTLAALAVGVATAGGLVLPALVTDWYGRLVTTGMVVTTTVGLGRLLAFTAPALSRRPRPSVSDEGRPTVSVLITAYDEADVLQGTIDACRALDYPTNALEILVCYEGASTDATPAIAERAATRHPSVEAIERPRPPGGKAAATNHALRHATGEVVAVIDADQALDPSAVRRAVAWFQADEDVWCVKGRRYGSNPRSSLVALHATVEHHLVERIEFVARDVLGGFTLFTGGQAFFRAEAFAELGTFDESVLLEDVEMACRLHLHGKRLRVDPAILTTETNPTTVRAWWHQRVRWGRGGLQVGRRHLRSIVAHPDLSVGRKLDAVATFGSLLLLPALVLSTPLLLLSGVGIETTPYLPRWWPLPFAVSLVGVPLVAIGLLFVVDGRAGRPHAARELLVPLTLPVYVLLQGLALAKAVIDEFVLRTRTVYVTS